MNKIFIFFAVAIICNVAIAESSNSYKGTAVDLDLKKISTSDKSMKLNRKINSLEIDMNEIAKKQNKITMSVERSARLQKEIHSDTLRLLELSKQKSYEVEPINLKLIQPINWYIFILPLVTVVIVISGTALSIKTIAIKSQESLSALNESNKNQYKMNKENISSDNERSREAIISDSRRKWINTLREDISSVLSNMTQYKAADKEGKTRIFNELWLEFYKIQLLLNPHEEDHKSLLLAIRNTFGCFGGGAKEFTDEQNKVVSMAQKVLKRERVRVKSFD